MEKRLIELIAKTFNLPLESIDSHSSSENVEKWDSLAHMNLIFAVEAEFGIEIADDELLDSMSVKKLLSIIEKSD